MWQLVEGLALHATAHMPDVRIGRDALRRIFTGCKPKYFRTIRYRDDLYITRVK